MLVIRGCELTKGNSTTNYRGEGEGEGDGDDRFTIRGWTI